MMLLRAAFLAAIIAIGVGTFAASNPFLFGIHSGIPHDSHFIYTKHSILDGELERVRANIPEDDFERYRNHCLRVLSFAKFHMPDFVLEEYPDAMNIVAMALAYHDVALWTDGELNYLEPSAKRMESYIRTEGVFDEKQIAIAREVIMQHHKYTDYSSSKDSNKSIDAMVNERSRLQEQLESCIHSTAQEREKIASQHESEIAALKSKLNSASELALTVAQARDSLQLELTAMQADLQSNRGTIEKLECRLQGLDEWSFSQSEKLANLLVEKKALEDEKKLLGGE
jgi:hypothetical protein